MTQDEIKSRLHYNQETGVFTWRSNPLAPNYWNTRYSGTSAGTKHPLGYIIISINKKRIYAHRAAFLYLYGVTPEEVDHIDGSPSNNSISNLRPVNRKTNMRNVGRSSSNTSGKTGVCWDNARGKWMAYINRGGKRVRSKRFTKRSDADLHRITWCREYEFHENHGRERKPLA